MAARSHYLIYLDTVPKNVRKNIQAALLEAQMHGYDTYINCAQYIMTELIAGNIHPEIAKESRAYLELILTAISAKQIAEAKQGLTSGKSANSSVAEQLSKAKRKAKKMKLELTDNGVGDLEMSLKALKDEMKVER
jgi:hypothetical protein